MFVDPSDTTIQNWYESARDQHPGVEMPPEQFAKHIAQFHDEARTGLMYPGDIYLALACLAGERDCLKQLDDWLTGFTGKLMTILSEPDTVKEVLQSVRVRLLLPADDGSAARLNSYRGQGPLQAWLRVIVVRAALTEKRRQSRSKEDLFAELLESLPADVAAQHEGLREQYGADLRASFQKAVNALTAKQRTVLRMHALDRLDVSDIAAAYGVHRTTAFRWLQKSLTDVSEAMVQHMSDSLDMPESEVKSLIRMLKSVVTLSMGGALAGESGNVITSE